jgi:hypothetical protein
MASSAPALVRKAFWTVSIGLAEPGKLASAQQNERHGKQAGERENAGDFAMQEEAGCENITPLIAAIV